MYLFKNVTPDIRLVQSLMRNYSPSMKLVLVSIVSAIAAILQSAGGFFPGVGFIISPLATAPVLLCFFLSIPSGMGSYLLVCLLLFFIQPSELFVFPFTTGMLGMGIGTAFYVFKKRLPIVALGAVSLTLGVSILLYVIGFPVLGPAVSSTFSWLQTGVIFLFSVLYTWLWVEMTLIFIRRIQSIFRKTG